MKVDRVCIFGYDGELNPIRPSLPGGIHENYLYIDGKFLIRPFAQIQFDFNNKVSHPPTLKITLLIEDPNLSFVDLFPPN